MALQIKRVFKIDGKDVPDQYPGLTPDRAKKMMVDQYPSIINSTWTERIDEAAGILYVEFSGNVVGTRG
jgi:PRTRC genetic system protein C